MEEENVTVTMEPLDETAAPSALDSALGYLEQYIPREQILLLGLSFISTLCYLIALFTVRIFFVGWKNYMELKPSRRRR